MFFLARQALVLASLTDACLVVVMLFFFLPYTRLSDFSTSAPLGALVLLVASDSRVYVCMSPCSGATQEQLQSGTTMVSVN